jgi:hypothetical protein
LNLGEVAAACTGNGGSNYWITIPMAEPISVVARYARWCASRACEDQMLSLLSASATEVDLHTGDRLGVLLTSVIRPYDLLVGAEANRWLLCLPRRRFDLERFAAHVGSFQRRFSGGRFGKPIAIAFDLLGSWDQPFPAVEIAQAARVIPASE